MPRLPVGQHEVPELAGARPGDPGRRSPWRLEVGGLVERPFTLTWDEFLALPQVDDVSDFHCVTTWSRYDNHWRGVRFSTLAEMAVPTDDATFVLCTGYDQMPGSDEFRSRPTFHSSGRSRATCCWCRHVGRGVRSLTSTAVRSG